MKNILNTSPESERPKIYIREPDGTTYQSVYQKQKNPKQILLVIYEKEPAQQTILISKGKLLDNTKSLQQNNIKQGSIIHILKKSAKVQQQGSNYLYVSYLDKLYKIKYNVNDSIIDLKKRIQVQTGVNQNMQVILFNGSFFQNDRKVSDYQLKNQDIVNMGKIQVNQSRKNFDQYQKTVFPVKISQRNRRGSDGLLPSLNQNKQKQIISLQNSDFERSNISSVKSFQLQNSLQRDKKNDDNEDIKSQQGQSPIIRGQGQSNVFKNNKQSKKLFGRMNSFEANALLFTNHLQQEKEQECVFKNSLTSSPFSLQTAFHDLMQPDKQQIVFCESYYQDEALNNLKKIQKQSMQKLQLGKQNQSQSAVKMTTSKQYENNQPIPKEQNDKNKNEAPVQNQGQN